MKRVIIILVFTTYLKAQQEIQDQLATSSQNRPIDTNLVITAPHLSIDPKKSTTEITTIDSIKTEIAQIRQERKQIIQKITSNIAPHPRKAIFIYTIGIALLNRLIKRIEPLIAQSANLPAANAPRPEAPGRLTLHQELQAEKAIIMAKQNDFSEKIKKAIETYNAKKTSTSKNHER